MSSLKAGPAPRTYNDLMGKAQERSTTLLRQLATDYRAGKIKYEPFVAAFKQQLTEAVRTGHKLGIAQAKQVYPPWSYTLTPAERRQADQIVGKQFDYFLKFREAIRKAEAEGPLTAAVDARAAMYGGSVRWAFEAGKLGADAAKRLVWNRHKDDSCETCLGMDGQEKTAAEWRAGGIWPAFGTQCLTNCGCSLDPVQ